jgi:hypothetical protein
LHWFSVSISGLPVCITISGWSTSMVYLPGQLFKLGGLPKKVHGHWPDSRFAYRSIDLVGLPASWFAYPSIDLVGLPANWPGWPTSQLTWFTYRLFKLVGLPKKVHRYWPEKCTQRTRFISVGDCFVFTFNYIYLQ